MIKLLMVAAILLLDLTLYAIFVPSPALAQDCMTYDAELVQAAADGFKIFVIPPQNLANTVADVEATTGDDYGNVTRGFLEFEPGVTTVGLEAHGCLYAPIYLPRHPEAGA